MTSEKVNQLAQIKELGYLVQVESLLSTFGDETHMLTDMEWGVEQLGRVKIRLESDSGYANHDPQQQENQAEAEAKAAGATRSRSSRKERGNNLVDDRGLDMMEMLDQIQVHVNQLPKSLANFKQDKEFAYSIGVKNRSKSTGVPALWPCLVVLTLPSSVYRRLPATFLYDDPTTSQPALYEVFPCLITQGVNEMQSLASRIGNTDLQAEINMRGTHRLNMYCDEFVKFKIDVLGCRQPAELERLADLMLEADSLRDLAPNSGQTKNLSFLRMSDELVRAMQGSKVVCCKSAKDRTSMATTWRHARILGEFHNVSEDSVTKATALMRLHGVRRTNVFKNTGKWNYAFNALQRKTLPGLFRAPDECCGTAVS